MLLGYFCHRAARCPVRPRRCKEVLHCFARAHHGKKGCYEGRRASGPAKMLYSSAPKVLYCLASARNVLYCPASAQKVPYCLASVRKVARLFASALPCDLTDAYCVTFVDFAPRVVRGTPLVAGGCGFRPGGAKAVAQSRRGTNNTRTTQKQKQTRKNGTDDNK